MASEKYWLWLDGQNAGPFTIAQINNSDLSRDALYYSERLSEWQPLKLLPKNEWDGSGNGRLESFKSAEIEWVQFLTSGNGDDCPLCLSMNEKIVRRSEAPEIPLSGCTCDPWAKCVWIAVKGPA